MFVTEQSIAAIKTTSIEPMPKSLTVGVKLSPDFVVVSNGIYSGIAIDKWSSIYQGVTKYKLYSTIDELLSGVESGEVDVAVGAITITAEREQKVDFLIPYTQTGLTIGTVDNESIFDVLMLIVPTFLKALGVILLVNLIAGALFATVEHRANNDIESRWSSMFKGFYWSSATLTTVGYGDVAAKTPLGILFSTLWMWSGLVITTGMMGLMVASVNVNGNNNTEFNILKSKIAVVDGSASLHYIERLVKDKNTYRYKTLEEAVLSVASGYTDGVIGDKTLLDSVAKDIPSVIISDLLLTNDYYAFAVKGNTDLDEYLNFKQLTK